MADKAPAPIPERDLTILRKLAQRKRELADHPLNAERRDSWLALHSRTAARPMILAEWGGVRDPKRPLVPALECSDPGARGLEHGLRTEIAVFEELRDDHVIEPFISLNWHVQCSGFGVQTTVHQVEGGILNARSWDAPITDIRRDFHLLQPRRFSVDREGTQRQAERLGSIFGDLLPVRLRGGFWWTMGLTIQAIDLIGLQNLMLFMYDDPEGLHRIMAFLRDDNLAFADWLEAEGLLTLNNENDYVGSGSTGYATDLPAPGYVPNTPARLRDLWVLVESQETVGVGPEQFAEFVFAYQKPIAARFGLVYYGCCEPVHTRWHVVRELPNLRSVSIAPLCNEEIMAEALGNRYVYSRKPNPTLISTPRFDEDLIRRDLRKTLDLGKTFGCRQEIIMKDVHTLNNEPGRLARWVELARDECERT